MQLRVERRGQSWRRCYMGRWSGRRSRSERGSRAESAELQLNEGGREQSWRRYHVLCCWQMGASVCASALADRPKEIREQGRAAFGEHTWVHLHAVVEAGIVADLEEAADRSCLGIVGTVDQAVDPSVDQGAGAHRAGFEGYIKGCTVDSPALCRSAGVTESDDFGVAGGVGTAFADVKTGADDRPIEDDERTDRNVPPASRFGGEAECLPHVTLVVQLLGRGGRSGRYLGCVEGDGCGLAHRLGIGLGIGLGRSDHGPASLAKAGPARKSAGNSWGRVCIVTANDDFCFESKIGP